VVRLVRAPGVCEKQGKAVARRIGIYCELVFFCAQNILASSLTSNHGVPMGNPHISVLVTKSAFTYTQKNVHSGGPRDKNAHLQQANASVCGRKYPRMLSHDDT
jgi:hypothetical protein